MVQSFLKTVATICVFDWLEASMGLGSKTAQDKRAIGKQDRESKSQTMCRGNAKILRPVAFFRCQNGLFIVKQ